MHRTMAAGRRSNHAVAEIERAAQGVRSAASTIRVYGILAWSFSSLTASGFRASNKHMQPEGYIGFVEELPGANTQGATLEEARANLHEAVAMVLEANRELIAEAARGGDVIREPLKAGE